MKEFVNVLVNKHELRKKYSSNAVEHVKEFSPRHAIRTLATVTVQ